MLDPEYRAVNWAIGKLLDKLKKCKAGKTDMNEPPKLSARRRGKKRRKRDRI